MCVANLSLAAIRLSSKTTTKATPRSFIIEHLEEIIREWESFARTVSPASATLDSAGLRDHVRQMLQAIALDIQTSQTDREQYLKSRGLAPAPSSVETAAETHGALRYSAGFDLGALVAEFRALRATVLRLWINKGLYRDDTTVYELARFNEAIDQALAESVAAYSEELTKSRATFLAILGHDLRSPLGAMVGALQILSEPIDGVARIDALAEGKRSASSMSSMIGDLLEYTRARMGKGTPIVPGEANLEAVCKSAIREASFIHPQTAFRLESSGNLDGHFDSARVHQVAANLLNNAVRHGDRGSPITLTTTGDPGALLMKVRNRGSVAADFLARIFDPLLQVPSAGLQVPPGGADQAHSTNMGLGLFIAREIVLAHDGTIDVTSSELEGTTFVVKLPRGPVTAEVPASSRESSIAI